MQRARSAQDTEHAGVADQWQEEAAAWAQAAVRECAQVWDRVGARYARRLAAQDRVRDVGTDVMTLAARRLLPLPRRVHRPLPDEHLSAVARAFNRLAAPDRYVLARLDVLGRLQGARAEHLASALERLVLACRSPRESPCSRGLQT
ncbi:MAG: hypothetical protein ACYTG2_14550 [Planctomycetota bacterium]|jgi:hypothetical protein